MRKTVLGFVLVSMAAFGCKKSGGAGDAVAKIEGFSKAMCECKDKACGDKVNDDMLKWSQEMAKSAGKDTEKPDPDLTKKMTDATQKLTECYTKLATAGAGAAAAPPADKPADPAAAAPADKPADPAAAAPADKPADPAAAKPADDKKPDDKKAGGW